MVPRRTAPSLHSMCRDEASISRDLATFVRAAKCNAPVAQSLHFARVAAILSHLRRRGCVQTRRTPKAYVAGSAVGTEHAQGVGLMLLTTTRTPGRAFHSNPVTRV